MIKDLGLIRMIDARLTPDAQEAITPGEAVAGMIRNGLGLANRPRSLTPSFYQQTARSAVSSWGPSGDVQSLDAWPDAR